MALTIWPPLNFLTPQPITSTPLPASPPHAASIRHSYFLITMKCWWWVDSRRGRIWLRRNFTFPGKRHFRRQRRAVWICDGEDRRRRLSSGHDRDHHRFRLAAGRNRHADFGGIAAD